MRPRIDELDGFVISIHTHDHSPPHVHVRKGKAELRIFLDSERSPEAVFGRMKASDERIAARIVEKRRAIYLMHWEEIEPQ